MLTADYSLRVSTGAHLICGAFAGKEEERSAGCASAQWSPPTPTSSSSSSFSSSSSCLTVLSPSLSLSLSLEGYGYYVAICHFVFTLSSLPIFNTQVEAKDLLLPFFFCYILLPLLQKLILMPARTVARTQYGAYSFRRFSRTFISLDLFRSERGCALSISNFFCSPSPTKTHYVTSNNVIAACLPWLVVDRSINDLLCTIVSNFGLSYIPWW